MRKFAFFFAGVFTLGLMISFQSCRKDKVPVIIADPGDCPDTISFATQVEPIMVANCSTSGCHDAASQANGYNLEGHANIATNANDILTVIKHEGGMTPMPYNAPKLADSLIQQFECWTAQGKLNN